MGIQGTLEQLRVWPKKDDEEHADGLTLKGTCDKDKVCYDESEGLYSMVFQMCIVRLISKIGSSQDILDSI